MRRMFLLIVLLVAVHAMHAQSANDLQESARGFQRLGDYANAVTVLKDAVAKYPENLELKKDLAINYYLQRQYRSALEVLDPILKSDGADEQTFQIAGLVYRSNLDYKNAEIIYKNALKKFPASGLIYADYGDMLELQEPGMGKGVKVWEQGIKAQPEYPGNYYYAAKAYSTTDPIWSLLYAEIFVNMESYSARTVEIKNLLLNGYRRLWTGPLSTFEPTDKFTKAVAASLKKQSALAASGVDAEKLSAIRARFILDWFHRNQQESFPFRLFDLHQQLLKDGLFDAYQQWLVGSVANLPAYQAWIKTNSEAYTSFTQFQQSKLFKMPNGQYYHN